MITHPEIYKKAQKEIDDVVGSERLPTFEDRPNLPYLECIMNEVLRWGVPVPLGLPHRLMEDNMYNGMFIPQGTLVFANIWKMLRDETVYPKPDEFIPERYMVEADEATVKRRDPRHYVFGFGRRRCPGLHLIDESLWIVMATMLATTDLAMEVDESGNVVRPDISFDNSVFRSASSPYHSCFLFPPCFCLTTQSRSLFSLTRFLWLNRTPTVFKCDIRPRSEQTLQLVRLSE